jgi:hypothetical protein
MWGSHTFLRGRLNAAAAERCASHGVNPDLIREELVDAILDFIESCSEEAENQLIRVVYDEFEDEKHIKSHIAAIFDVSLSWVCKLLHEPTRGTRENTGRPSILTDAEIDTIVEYIRDQQRACKCVSVREATSYINNTFLDGDVRKVSPSYLWKNKKVKDTFQLVSPQLVEYLRVQACTYQNFDHFFNRLTSRYAREFKPEFIVNVDETSTSVLRTKKAIKVLYDPDLDIQAIANGDTNEEHVTLTCAVSASGEMLRPCFIIKNQTVTGEADLHCPLFPCAPYLLQYSPNGWQSSVSCYSVCIYVNKILFS